MVELSATAKYIYEALLQKKRLFERAQGGLQRRSLATRKTRRELRLNSLDCFLACSLLLLSKSCQLGANAPAIIRIVQALHQPVRFQAVNQLRHVRSNAAEPRCQLT